MKEFSEEDIGKVKKIYDILEKTKNKREEALKSDFISFVKNVLPEWREREAFIERVKKEGVPKQVYVTKSMYDYFGERLKSFCTVSLIEHNEFTEKYYNSNTMFFSWVRGV